MAPVGSPHEAPAAPAAAAPAGSEPVWAERLLGEPLQRKGQALVYAPSFTESAVQGGPGRLASRIVERVYCDHNRARIVRRTIERLLGQLRAGGGLGLNFGSGGSPRRDNVVNLDIYLTDQVDIVYDGRRIPFRDATFDFIMSQEVFEHIADPEVALDEVARVARPGAKFYLQLPFIIGYHSVPGDYWRFSVVGIERFVESRGTFKVVEKGIAVGHGTGLYRVLVEFLATTASVFGSVFYKPTKLLFAILFYWLKFFDLLTPLASEPHRIAGGYYVVAERV